MPARTRLAAVALALVATLSVSPPTASAGSHEGPIKSSCSGSKLATRVIRSTTGRLLGRAELWYSSRSGGQNCVITYNEVPGRAYTYAWLVVDDNRNRRHDPNIDRASADYGHYLYYAGASYRNRTNGKCVRWGGSISDELGFGDTHSPGWVHCG